MHGCRLYANGGRDVGSLVVTRKDGEGIQIGDDIRVEIMSIEGRRAKVRVIAPKSIQVLRTELVDTVQDVTVGMTLSGHGRGPRRAA